MSERVQHCSLLFPLRIRSRGTSREASKHLQSFKPTPQKTTCSRLPIHRGARNESHLFLCLYTCLCAVRDGYCWCYMDGRSGRDMSWCTVLGL
ncbi:hypothetical protein BCV70DRAFT_23219 [Testicularia cyperi]|uniref:Uncharacterized protein n=1 Tax=Testicularia cyperi TaxID=1882483 RepID=A0A317XZT1_9BASI|nr:hypothetical protein BCV70DRAFT_23219 [Testicularia cyperi]